MEIMDQNRLQIKRALAGTENADFVYDKYVDLQVKSILNDLKTKGQPDYIVMQPEELPVNRLLQLFKDYELGLIECLLSNLHLLLLHKEMKLPFQSLIAQVTSHLSQHGEKKKRFYKQLDYFTENEIETIDEFIGQLLLSLNPDIETVKCFLIDSDYSASLKLILFKKICWKKKDLPGEKDYHAPALDYILYAAEEKSTTYSYNDILVLLETYTDSSQSDREQRCRYALRKLDICYSQNPKSRSTFVMQRLLPLFGSTLYLLFFPVKPPALVDPKTCFVRPLIDALYLDDSKPSNRPYLLDGRQVGNLLRNLIYWRVDQEAVRFFLKNNYIYKGDNMYINIEALERNGTITKEDHAKKKIVTRIVEALKMSGRQGEIVAIMQQYHDSEFNAMLMTSMQHDKYMWRLWDALLALKTTNPKIFQATVGELTTAYFRNKLPRRLVYRIQKYQPKK